MHRGALPRPPRSAGRAGCYKLVTNYGTRKLTLGCVFLDLWDPRPHLANQIGVKSNRRLFNPPIQIGS